MCIRRLHLILFQAEDGIRYLVRSRGLGDVYKRQVEGDGLSSYASDETTMGVMAFVVPGVSVRASF